MLITEDRLEHQGADRWGRGDSPSCLWRNVDRTDATPPGAAHNFSCPEICKESWTLSHSGPWCCPQGFLGGFYLWSCRCLINVVPLGNCFREGASILDHPMVLLSVGDVVAGPVLLLHLVVSGVSQSLNRPSRWRVIEIPEISFQ